ncbi:hypothetical protein SH139x_005382 [Planctomycetaceae bacterium SH139]
MKSIAQKSLMRVASGRSTRVRQLTRRFGVFVRKRKRTGVAGLGGEVLAEEAAAGGVELFAVGFVAAFFLAVGADARCPAGHQSYAAFRPARSTDRLAS